MSQRLHLLHSLDPERFQTLLQNARGQFAQRQPGIARGGILGLQHGAVFVKASELTGQFEQIIAQEIRAIFFSHRFERETEIQQMIRQRDFFRCDQMDVGC